MKKTATDLVKSIPERLDLELDLSTPQKALEFLRDEDCPVFYWAGQSQGFEDYSNDTDWIVRCGYRAMHVFNELFSPEQTNDCEKYAKYCIDTNETKIEALIDYDEDIAFCSNVSFYEEENTEYIAVLPGGSFVNFKKILEACSKICKETNDKIRFEPKTVSREPFGYNILPNGAIKPFGKFTIVDDNANMFAGGLTCFISLFGCETFEEMENICVSYEIETTEQKTIDKNSGILFAYRNKEMLKNLTDTDMAAEIIKEYPCILPFLPLATQSHKKVAMSFIEGNEPYMAAYNKFLSKNQIYAYGEWINLSAILSSETANLLLNGIIPCGWNSEIINETVLNAWCSDEEIFEALLCSSMFGQCRIQDEMFKKTDHKAMFKKSPKYTGVLYRYFSDRQERLLEAEKAKEDLHIRRKYRLSEDVQEDNIVLLKTFETLEKDCPDAFKVLSVNLNDYELFPLVQGYLLSLPLQERDKLIRQNIRLAYLIKNTLSNDEEIVEYICQMCECAGDFLSDEIVEIRGLKRTNLDISKVCGNCNFC